MARHTATGVTVGTAAYLAPEQVRGRNISPATDVYSLGLVLLEALTGERAYRGSPTEAALARLTTPPPMPEQLPRRWRALLHAMTDLDPARRPTTSQLARTLGELAAGVDPATATTAPRTDSSPNTQPLTTPVTAGDDPPLTAGTMWLRQPRQARRRWSLPSARSRVAAVGRSWRWVAAATALVLAVVTIVVFLASGSDGASSDVPASVPPRLEQPLQDLHDAVEGQL